MEEVSGCGQAVDEVEEVEECGGVRREGADEVSE